MKRKALLIEASSVRGQTKLPGAEKDPEMIQRYLWSPAGGDWAVTETEIIRNPSISSVRTAIKASQSADYAFVAFSGHGRHVTGKTVDETRITLADGELAAHELNTGSDRCTVLIDACRHVTHLVENVERYARAKAAQFSITTTKRGYREYFDAELLKCEKGAIYLFSCDLDEAAGENTEGGFFSLFLVNGGENWHDEQKGWANKVYSMNTAFDVTSKATTRRQPQQHPQYQPGRRNGHFPFAVWVA